LEVLQQIHSISTLHNCCLESSYNDVIAEIMEHMWCSHLLVCRRNRCLW